MMRRLCATSLITRTRRIEANQPRLCWGSQPWVTGSGIEKAPVPARHTLQTPAVPCSGPGEDVRSERSGGEEERRRGAEVGR